MPAPTETEIKLGVPPQSIGMVEEFRPLKNVAAARTADLISTYYDTADQALARLGMSLRVRRDGDRRIQTLKADANASAGLARRREWETELDGDELDVAAARKTGVGSVFSKKVRDGLKPVFQTRVHRKIFPVRDGDASVEVAIDRGEIIADKRSAPISEVELELKRGGSSEKLFEIAGAMADVAPVSLEVRSKAERGYALITGTSGAVEKAAPVFLRRGMPAAEAFRIVARSCLRQVIANEEAVRQENAEGVHQMRVGLRRLRAMISIFKRMLDDRETTSIRRELRWLTNILGPARQLRVFESRAVRALRQANVDATAIDALVRGIAARREEAAAGVRDALDSGRYRRLQLETAEWIEAGAWSTSLDPMRRRMRERPIGKFAADSLGRRTKSLIRKARGLRKMNAERRHKVRIKAKKVRYAAEVFAGLFDGDRSAGRRKKFEGALRKLQDSLGDLNDVTADAKLATDIANPSSGSPLEKSHRQLAYAAGAATGYEQTQRAALVRTSIRAGGRLEKVSPFWA